MTTTTEALPAPKLLKTACGLCAAHRHELCPRAVYNPGAPQLDDKGKPTGKVGVALYCPCTTGTHPIGPRCRDCGKRGEALTGELTCIDSHSCQLEIAARLDTDPTARLIRECRTTKIEGGEVVDRPRKPTKTEQAAAKAAKAAKVARLCTCGCGGTTKGGAFLPGHDARYVSALAQATQGVDPVAKDAQVEAGRTALADFPALLAKFNKRVGGE